MSNQLPQFIIIGAMKSATTSLHYYLNLHPELSMSTVKETNFFLEENFSNGLDWYKKLFEKNDKLKGEASPNYTKYPELSAGVAERMHETLPNSKLIYILRDPIERYLSHVHHQMIKKREKRSMDEIIEQSDKDYLVTSQYFFQLQHFLKFYHKENIYITSTENLKNNQITELQQIFEFLGVNKNFESEQFSVKRHQSSKKSQENFIAKLVNEVGWIKNLKNKVKKVIPYSIFSKIMPIIYVGGKDIPRPQLNENQRNKLVNLLKNDIKQLKDFTGKDFSEWKNSYE